MTKMIIAHNQDNLPTAKYTDFTDLQGDLKTLPKENQEKLKNSIINYGIRFPAFIWQSEGKKYIVDAHQRKKVFAILEKEGWAVPRVPYTNIYAKNKKEAAELLLQANSRYGVYNPETTFFEDFDIDLSFINDIEIPELDIKLDELTPEIVEDEVPEPLIEPLSKTGDLWLCGKHRVLCGDATKEADIERLIDSKKADLVFTDPPYGLNIIKIKNKKEYGLSKQTKYKNENWDSKIPSKTAFDNIFKYSKNQIVWGANYFWGYFRSTQCYLIWDKRGDLPKVPFADTEFAWTSFDKMSKKYTFIHHGFITTEKEEQIHPTQKPIKLYAEILSDFTKENDIIADFFLGSGTTLIACEQLNRICYGCEIDPHYTDVILDRYAKYTGDDPIRESDNVKWSELKSSIVV